MKRALLNSSFGSNSYYLGEPDELFYWGPSRAKPKYMSDFMAAVEQFFIDAANDPTMPNPPKSIVLFWDGKMVWLSNAVTFREFVEKAFELYEKQDRISQDIQNWKEIKDVSEKLLKAWGHTLFAEFSLYGAESVIAKRLERFDSPARQEIWGAFTSLDNSTFLARIDKELLGVGNATTMAQKYPWIQDGYDGVNGNATNYFEDRLKNLQHDANKNNGAKKDKSELIEKYNLSDAEVKTLNLARQLAEFMDDRKAWMMQTRRHIQDSLTDIEFGWLFDDGKSFIINKEDTKELWERYVNFKLSSHAVKGTVASNGGKHFVNGEVAIVSAPTDIVDEGKIIVVPSTSPSYVTLMRKAKALVTDHGGIMSHAAIVAREFNLPCIVGTKNATKVLKTGDKVILDLVKGEVNK